MAEDTRVTLVAAVAENGVIGNGGALPWRLPSDLKRFRKLTMGCPVIMGRKTFESLGKPLDGRDNIVVTRNADFKAQGIILVLGVDEALRVARQFAVGRAVGRIAVIGGAEIFALMLGQADVIEMTEVHAAPEGDTVFPELDRTQWKEVARERHAAGKRDSADYSFVRLERVR